MLGGALSAQGAYRLSEFVSEEEFKHEVDLSAGPAIPSGNMRTSLPAGSGFGENVPQGANFGGGAKVAYRFYPLRQLYLGVTLYGQWYGYEYKYFDLSSADRVEHSGWDAYGGTLEIGTRLPTGVYGLYFTARIQAGYALLCSPRVSAIYSTPTAGDIERPILVRSYKHGLYLGGGVGVQYRFPQALDLPPRIGLRLYAYGQVRGGRAFPRSCLHRRFELQVVGVRGMRRSFIRILRKTL